MKLKLELKKYFAELGRRGHARRTQAQAEASRRNGKKGGRPKLKKTGNDVGDGGKKRKQSKAKTETNQPRQTT